jgi:hypothetical protein
VRNPSRVFKQCGDGSSKSLTETPLHAEIARQRESARAADIAGAGAQSRLARALTLIRHSGFRFAVR